MVNEQKKNWRILKDAMENQQKVAVEFQENSTRYACQCYIRELTSSCVMIEECEGERKDIWSVYFLDFLVSVRMV